MKDHLQKCLLCPKSACSSACPAGTQISDAIKLIRNGESVEAGRILFENNPLTAITGAVCPNHLYCHGACVLGKRNNAVDFGKIESVVSVQYLNTLLCSHNITPAHNENPKRILIVGSGPSGLAMAYYLRKKGHCITVYERRSKFGGMLRYGIPDFRLDKSLVDKLVMVLTKMRVLFINNKEVDLSDLNSLHGDFDAVILAIGAHVPRHLGIDGEQEHALTAVDFLKAYSEDNTRFSNAKHALVLGGGNVAIDCALAAKHRSPDCDVAVCYRRSREELKCYPEELQYAIDRGVQLKFHMVPKKINKESVSFDCNGEEVILPANLVITAIGQQALANEQEAAIQTERGFIKTEQFKTNIENVFALGDAVTGTQTIIKAVAAAKELATLFC